MSLLKPIAAALARGALWLEQRWLWCVSGKARAAIALAQRHDHLLHCTVYPSTDKIYGGGFIHQRVKHYAAAGLTVLVFQRTRAHQTTIRTFDGVTVIEGRDALFATLLDQHTFDRVLVHFLSERTWEILAPRLRQSALLVWIHGADIQPWHERDFSAKARSAKAKRRSDARVGFWRRLVAVLPPRCTLVFVSAYLRDQLPTYIGRPLPPDTTAVIHNPINTDLFRYIAKPAAQRLKILSIRPYTSEVYANDIAVQAITLLAQRPCFSVLSFHLIGDGSLFDATVAPLRDFPNVTIERHFLLQTEIAARHQDYGVFLIPTRMDSHGVSRDEAMASGLVPITSRVAAIPEFVDETCAMLTPPDDAAAIAAAIEHLHDHPEHFTALSAAAAARVRRQAGHEITIPQELALLRGSGQEG